MSPKYLVKTLPKTIRYEKNNTLTAFFFSEKHTRWHCRTCRLATTYRLGQPSPTPYLTPKTFKTEFSLPAAHPSILRSKHSDCSFGEPPTRRRRWPSHG